VGQRQDEFERVAMPHSRSLLRVARRLASDPAQAEDLVQETLLSAWRGFHQFRPGTNARAWLFRILMNTYHGQGRKPHAVPERAVAVQPHPSESFEVAQALAQLAVEHRTVLLLGVVEGFTSREMAEILSVPIGTVMSRMSRARQALRQRLAPECAKKGAS